MAIKDLAVAFNGSDNSRAAVRLAVQMCRKYGATLTGIYTHQPVRFEGRVEKWISEDMRRLLEKTDAETTAGIESDLQAIVKETDFEGPRLPGPNARQPFDRRGQLVVKARLFVWQEFPAEPLDHTRLVGRKDVDSAQHPQREHRL